MAKLTDDMKDLVASQQAFVATASPDGVPNISIKGSTRVLDDEHMVFHEVIGGRTWQNIQQNPIVAIAVADRGTMKGYRFVGRAEVVTEGELFEEAKALVERLKLPMPPKAAVKIKVDEVYNLGAGGQKVG